MRDVYIIAAKRSAITKAKKGGFANFRPDELLAQIIENVVDEAKINPADIGDVVIGCAFPEAEQGQNIARIASLLAGLPDTVPGMTINRYCSSGVNSIAIVANAIQAGQYDVALAGGIESMSMIPMGGNDYSISPLAFKNHDTDGVSYTMGLTAENVANKWGVSREDQDAFALSSNRKAVEAIQNGTFKEQIVPIHIKKHIADKDVGEVVEREVVVDTDECPHADTSLDKLAKLPSVFAAQGSVTAGNSSQMSDGASVLILVSGDYLKQHNLTPMAKFLGFAVVGVDPKFMGIGPIKAVPKVLQQTNLTLDQIDIIELNEAFASQSLAVIRDLKLDIDKVNPYGGAIALGHPLGATGAILTTKLLYGLKQTNKKFGMVTMCIGSGMGAAAIFENC